MLGEVSKVKSKNKQIKVIVAKPFDGSQPILAAFLFGVNHTVYNIN